MERVLKYTKNPLLTKDDVGHAKPTVRDLPPEDFAYGKADEPDAEGVSESKLTPNAYSNTQLGLRQKQQKLLPREGF